MYINEDVDLPEELVSAQREGTLVVFAGAGVSMGPPSNLPGFEDLALEVAGNSGTPTTGEPFDRFLGRLEASGLDVQSRTRKIIDKPTAKPTDLHRDLVALFPSPEQLRLVTTNFDRHFSTVARERFGHDVEFYYAPALPLGREVDGLVYLHGAVEKATRPLVLTDRDFGRAYLTDGWATRMLREMFATFTVLFVGYSHDDAVMQYLARGLVPDTSRYALVPEGNHEHWRLLGVEPVPYPIDSDERPHAALPRAVASWVEDASRGVLEHGTRIREIVRGTPPLERDLADYIASALTDVTRLRFFVEHASSVEWLHWADDEGALTALFSAEAAHNEEREILARWFASVYAVDQPETAVGIAMKYGGIVSSPLWMAIISRLCAEPTPSSDVFAVWVALLCRSGQAGGRALGLPRLLEQCQYPQDRSAMMVLLRSMMKPRITAGSTFGPKVSRADDGQMRVRASIAIDVEDYVFRQAWEQAVKPHLESLGPEIAEVAGEHLAQAHEMLHALGTIHDGWDALSFGRSAIEPHPQDRFAEAADLLIDIARDALGSMMRHTPNRGNRLTHRWSKASSVILQRLGINGLAESPDLDPSKALDLIMDRGWLYETPLKHEVFRLLESAYPRAVQEDRREFLSRTLKVPVIEGGAGDEESQRIEAYERYNLAVWLQRVAPDCPVTAYHLDQLQERHPDFRPRPHPDLSVVMGETEWVGPKDLVPGDELKQMSVADIVHRWKELEGSESLEGLAAGIQDATVADPSWALGLLDRFLEDRSVAGEALWRSVVDGWKQAELDHATWRDVLDRLTVMPETVQVARATADLVEDGLQTEAMPDDLIGPTEVLADRLFSIAAAASEEEVELREGGDWLTMAINHLGGDSAQVWLQALSRRRSASGSEWEGLPDDYQRRLEPVLSGSTVAAQLARVVIASQLAFFYHLDREWARQKLIPLFDWSRNERTAEQVWHGYAAWGRMNEPLVHALLPFIQESFSRLGSELAVRREPLCQRLATIAVQSEVHPLESGWVTRFAKEADLASRATWASAVGRQLRSMDHEAKNAEWNRWIRNYWKDRIEGVPEPLDDKEAEAMLEWSLELIVVSEEVVELVERHPVPMAEGRSFLYHVEQGALPEQLAEPMGRLFLILLESTSQLTYECPSVEKITERLIAGGAKKEVLLATCDELGRLGCPRAAELRERAEKNTGGDI